MTPTRITLKFAGLELVVDCSPGPDPIDTDGEEITVVRLSPIPGLRKTRPVFHTVPKSAVGGSR
jgi:hypothetical protein